MIKKLNTIEEVIDKYPMFNWWTMVNCKGMKKTLEFANEKYKKELKEDGLGYTFSAKIVSIILARIIIPILFVICAGHMQIAGCVILFILEIAFSMYAWR